MALETTYGGLHKRALIVRRTVLNHHPSTKVRGRESVALTSTASRSVPFIFQSGVRFDNNAQDSLRPYVCRWLSLSRENKALFNAGHRWFQTHKHALTRCGAPYRKSFRSRLSSCSGRSHLWPVRIKTSISQPHGSPYASRLDSTLRKYSSCQNPYYIGSLLILLPPQPTAVTMYWHCTTAVKQS